MRVHPAILALQRHPTLQRRSRSVARAALRDWSTSDAVADLRRELAQYDAGEPLHTLPVLDAVFSDHGLASHFVSAFCERFIDALQNEPLGEVPLRHGSSVGFSRLQLLQSGGVAVSMCAYEPVTTPQYPTTVQFADCDAVEMVIAGVVDGQFYALEDPQTGAATLQSRCAQWSSGSRIIRRGACETRHFIDVHQTALVLQLTRIPANPRPTVEHRLCDGALIHQSSGDKRASEQVMALAVLGAMEHRAGLGMMADFARAEVNDPDARWEAVRQVLAMDTSCGLDLLSRLAAQADDRLQKPAAALRDQLQSTNPQLRRYERQAS